MSKAVEAITKKIDGVGQTFGVGSQFTQKEAEFRRTRNQEKMDRNKLRLDDESQASSESKRSLEKDLQKSDELLRDAIQTNKRLAEAVGRG